MLKRAASIAPAMAPAARPGNSIMVMGHMIALRRWCANMELSEVTSMVDSEVATAMCTANSEAAGCWLNSQLSAGTSTSPPPMPR